MDASREAGKDVNQSARKPQEALHHWLRAAAQASRQRTSDPAWLAALREAAAEQFASIALPTRKTEHWRYTSVAPLAALCDRSTDNAPDHARSRETTRPSPDLPETLGKALELVLIDGRLRPSSWQHPAVSLTRFADASGEDREQVIAALTLQDPLHPFLVLNAACSHAGLLIRVRASSEPLPPLVIRHLTTASAAMHGSRVVLLVEAGAKAELVEIFAGRESGIEQQAGRGAAGQGAQALSNPVTQIILEDSARLDHYAIHIDAPDTTHTGFLAVHQQRHSHYEHHALARGTRLMRRDIRIDLAEPGATVRATGVYLLSAAEHCDFHTCINHIAPRCSSVEAFRGMIGGTAKAVFNGRIHIFRDAQKSSAELNNDNLLLTPTAEVDTKPELEIYADDVKCSHGATVGQMDKQAIYYCQSRGIGKAEAVQMLSQAFVNEILGQLPNPALAAWLRDLAEPFCQEALS